MPAAAALPSALGAIGMLAAHATTSVKPTRKNAAKAKKKVPTRRNASTFSKNSLHNTDEQIATQFKKGYVRERSERRASEVRISHLLALARSFPFSVRERL